MSTLDSLAAEIAPIANLSLVLATVWLINQEYANTSTSPFALAQYSTTKNGHFYHNDLIDAILERASNAQNPAYGPEIKYSVRAISTYKNEEYLQTFRQILENDILIFQTNIKKSRSIVLLDSLAAFTFLENDLKNPRNDYHRDSYFCIIYTGNESNPLPIIEIIFRRLFRLYIVNVNVFIKKEPQVYTYFPFDRKKCHSTRPHFYISHPHLYNNVNVSKQKDFFPAKTANLHGCSIVVATWHAPPYMIIERNRKTKYKSLHGIEGMLITVLASRMNFSIEVFMPRHRGLEDITIGRNSTGVTQMLLSGIVNITMGNFLRTLRRCEAFEPAFPYLYVPVAVCVPQGRQLTPFQRLTYPFHGSVWFCLISFIITGISITWCIRIFHRKKITKFIIGPENRIPITNLFNTLFGGPIDGKLPKGNFARYLLGIWLLFTIVIRSAYVGELYTQMQSNTEIANIQSLEEAFSQNYTFYAQSLLLNILNEIIGTASTSNFDNHANTFDKVLERLQRGETKETVLHPDHMVRDMNAKRENANRRIRTLKEKMVTMQITFYMPKHSYLANHVDKLILDIMSAGLLQKFESNYLKSTIFVEPKHKPTRLNIKLLSAIFNIYFVLLLFGLIIFLLEVWSTKSLFIKNMIDFLNA